MKTISEDRGRHFQWMLEGSAVPLPLDHFSTVVSPTGDDMLYAMPFGCVVAPNGDIHVLHVYATHGVAAAVLCPEQAKAFGVPQPTGSRGDLPVMAYQEFELECGEDLPLLRVSSRFGLSVSHGRGAAWPTLEQQKALKRILVANDAMTAEINTEVSGSVYGHTYLLLLQLGERDTDYTVELNAPGQAEEQ